MTIVEDALRVWREAERLLESLSPSDPDLTAVSDIAEEVRVVYHDVAGRREYLTEQKLASSELVIRRAEALLERVGAPAILGCTYRRSHPTCA